MKTLEDLGDGRRGDGRSDDAESSCAQRSTGERPSPSRRTSHASPPPITVRAARRALTGASLPRASRACSGSMARASICAACACAVRVRRCRVQGRLVSERERQLPQSRWRPLELGAARARHAGRLGVRMRPQHARPGPARSWGSGRGHQDSQCRRSECARGPVT